MHLGDHGDCQCALPNAIPGPDGPAGVRGDPGRAGEFGQEGDVGDSGPQGEDGFPVRKNIERDITLKHHNICVLCSFIFFCIVI